MPVDIAGTLLPDLQASRERLLAVVAGVGEEQFKRRPSVEAEAVAGEWSIAEVLAHLLASEQRAGDRVEALLAHRATPDPGPTEEERNAEARLGRSVPVPQIIHGLLAARRRLERALTESRAGVPEAVGGLVRADVIEHETAHAAQIEAVRAALGAARAKA
jgi:uncharacterized damage-inducible protein DinB